jgi:D-alanine-D-alanine ligase
MKKGLILINELSPNPTPDELDVLDQARAVEDAMKSLGYETSRLFFGLDLKKMREEISHHHPTVVFNLVEAVGGKVELNHIPCALLESLEIPFTGSGSLPMHITTKKVPTKELFRKMHIPTANWYLPTGEVKPEIGKKYMLKPLGEDGSVGITDQNVIVITPEFLEEFTQSPAYKKTFLEDFIHGREFNLSLLGGPDGPTVMPAAEILYVDYPPDKPKILGYASKWEESSFEYNNTPRTFDLPGSDSKLVQKLNKICLDCWHSFDLKGYVRVDFRVNELNEPFVLEINANPCISPGAGYIAACRQIGLDYPQVVERIIYDALQ